MRSRAVFDESVWALLLLGWCASAAALHLGWVERRLEAAPAPRAPGTDLDSMSPRELRRLPGLGEVRALALANDRWQRRSSGAPLDLEALPGIGPKTAAGVREALAAEHGAPAPGGRIPPAGLHSPESPERAPGPRMP